MIVTLFYVALIIFIALIVYVIYMSKKYGNPYKLYMVFGKKGSGKTTYMCKIALKYRKLGYTVYSSVRIPGTIYIPDIDQKLLYSAPAENSVILIDEVGMIWDNRNYKAFRNEIRDFFKLQRHYRCIVYLFSQTFDVDIKLRVLTDAMFLCTNFLPGISMVRRIKRTIVLVQPVADAEGRIADSLEFIPIWMSLFGMNAISFTYIPRYAKYFDSFAVDPKPELRGTELPLLQTKQRGRNKSSSRRKAPRSGRCKCP